MKKMLALISLTALFVTAGVALGEGPAGLMKKGKAPPGFSKGKKEGWQSEYPPGWDKKTATQGDMWKQAVKKGREGVSKDAKNRGLTEREINSAADDFEQAARKGLGPEEAERLIRDKMATGKKGEELSFSAAEETQMLIKKRNQKGNMAKDQDKSKAEGKKQGKGRGK